MDDNSAVPAATAGILTWGEGATIAYDGFPGKNPGIVFLHGFRSDRTGEKAMAAEAFCRARGLAFVRFDNAGHGESSGAFEDGTIGQWAAATLAVIDHLTQGPQILVGSSMGGWLMLLAALARPGRVAGLLGIAAAPDFTEERIFEQMTAAQKATLAADGRLVVEDDYSDEPLVLTEQLVGEGRNHLLLTGPIPIACPVRLLHGQRDEDVPWNTALRLAERLNAADVEVTLVKGGGHRLSEPDQLALMTRTLGALVDRVAAGLDGTGGGD